MHHHCKSNVLLCFFNPLFSLNSGHTVLMCFGESDDKSHSALNGGGIERDRVREFTGRRVALRGDDWRREMQIFPVCLFLSILWIYVAFPIMK